MGHSLGGILARLIAIGLLDDGLIDQHSLNVIMFDSWCQGTHSLDLDQVTDYLKV